MTSPTTENDPTVLRQAPRTTKPPMSAEARNTILGVVAILAVLALLVVGLVVWYDAGQKGSERRHIEKTTCIQTVHRQYVEGQCLVAP